MMRKRILLLGLLVYLGGWLQAQERPRIVLQKGHDGSSTVLATAPLAPPLAATASDDGTVKIWDLEKKVVVRTLYDSEEAKGPQDATQLVGAVFSPDDKWVVTRDRKGTFRRYSLPDGELLGRFSLQGAESGREVLLTDGLSLYFMLDRELIKTDLQGEILARVRPLAQPSDNGYFSLSRDGRYLALGDKGMVWVGDTERLGTLASRQLTFPLYGLAFRPDSTALTISSESAVADLALPELEVTNLLEKSGTLRYPRSVPFWTEGRLFLLAMSVTPGSPILEVDYGAGTFSPRGEECIAQSFSLTDDGRLFVGGFGEGSFRSLEDGSVEVLQAEMGGFTSLAIASGSGDFFTGSVHGTVTRWSAKTGRSGRVYSGLEGYVSEVAVSPDGKTLVAGDYHDGRVAVWDIESGKRLFSTESLGSGRFGEGVGILEFLDEDRFVVGTREKRALFLYSSRQKRELQAWELPSYPSSFAWNSSKTRFAVGYRDGCLEQSVADPTDYRSVSLRGRVWSLAFGEGDRSLFLGLRNKPIFRWDLTLRENKAEEFASWGRGLNEVRELSWTPKGLEAFSGFGYRVLYAVDGSRSDFVELDTGYLTDVHRLSAESLVGIGSGPSILFLNSETGERQATVVGVRNNLGWVALDRSGEFDGNDIGLQTISFELDGSLFGVDQFLNQYFRPGVIRRLLPRSDTSSSPTRSGPELTAQTLRKPPSIKILEPKSGTFEGQEKISVKVRVTERGAGASRVALIHNGHKLPASRAQKQADGTYLFHLRPLKGKNDIRATAFDAEGKVESRQARVRILAPNVQARAPRLHLLTIGIDDYQSGLSLEFAENDAKAVSQLFDSELYERGTRLHLVNEKASLVGIKQAIRQISAEAEPQDAFVLYLAGHGTVVGDRYFFLPSDVKIESDQALAQSALSSEELGESLREVPATKQILVLDSCRSGAAVGVVGRYYAARSGLEEIRSQQLLARASGTFLVAATKAEDYAYEIPELGHGVLTYAILEALGVKEGGAAKVDRRDGVTANELLQSVSARVPELSEKFQNVRQNVMQYSSGQDFLIAK